ncbi:hypothetical protein CWI36_0484p0010 [Hamiltosporidium magnivora]|uniref:Uncharacterized protein n=1 Tax=Hamiltosporidium magnivora TaxID=148818 RepID=A0A4Q9LF48_9MICR|nr:hypothetical protein CWI36_0484p0010 [Hamiltosporidium magnivora]
MNKNISEEEKLTEIARRKALAENKSEDVIRKNKSEEERKAEKARLKALRENKSKDERKTEIEFCELCVSYALNDISRILNTHGKRCRDLGLEDPPTNILTLCATFDEEENFNN